MNPLLRGLIDHWDDLARAPWGAWVRAYGEAVAPFANLAPVDAPLPDSWRQQVTVETLGHVGTLQLLTSWQRPFMVVKGIAWGAQLWGDWAKRPGRDLDLVIPAADLAAWQGQLAAAGFQTERSPLEWIKGRQIVQLHHDGPSPHWLHRVGPPWSDFGQRSPTIRVSGVTAAGLDQADTLLYLAHHQVFRHGLDHDLGWLDLAAWLRLPQAPEALATALTRAAGSHLERSLIVLAWAWRHAWGQPGFDALTERPNPLVASVCGYLQRHPSDSLGQTALSLLLAKGHERQALLAGAWHGFRRWRGRRPPIAHG